MIASPVPCAEPKPDRPAWIDAALMAETRAVWEPLYGRELTDGEVLGILLSVGRLIDAIEESSL